MVDELVHRASASRLAVAEHALLVAEQADRHTLTLESLLAVLRSPRLDDRAARRLAVETATTALVQLRTVTDEVGSTMLEPVVGAFSRLRTDLKPLARFGGLAVQFVEPPAAGRALPGEVAHTARAIVRSAVLALVNEGASTRVRVQWDCDGLNLLISIRDDGPGVLSEHDDSIRPIAQQVAGLDGVLAVSATPGWGSSLDIRLPLDPPPPPEHLPDVVLSTREREVLQLLVSGARNRDIAGQLGITDNTVKFHVSNLLRKTSTRTRAELVGHLR